MKRLLLSLLLCAVPGQAKPSSEDIGFLVLAPDRGFLGNEEVRDAFEAYRPGYKAALVFLGDAETALFLEEGLSALHAQGARQVIALPLFLSDRHPALRRAREVLSRDPRPAFQRTRLRLAPGMAGHYLAAEILADRVRRLSAEPRREALVLVAQGAKDEENAEAIEADLIETARGLPLPLAFAWRGAVALEGWDPLRGTNGRGSRKLREILEGLREEGLKPVLVPFDFTTKLDSMMVLSTRLAPLAAEFSAAFDGADLTPHPNIALWLRQESNRRLPVSERELGVVFMPHGADQSWNRTMMEAVSPLARRAMIEPAFSMADPVVMERAVRRLEARGARAITVLRVFSLKESFRAQTEYALGLEPEEPDAHAHYAPASPALESGHHAHGHGHGHGDGGAPPAARIRSSAALHTLGGIEDSPLFASALAERAWDLSRDPDSETVFLLAHGSGSDEENRRWLRLLESLAGQIQELSRRRGAPFREIRVGTLREDWPEKRAAALKAIREEVRQASSSGRAIVIPARTALGGPERELLAGLDFSYAGQSFAPHPNFTAWVQSQIRASLDHFNAQREAGLTTLRPGSSPSR